MLLMGDGLNNRMWYYPNVITNTVQPQKQRICDNIFLYDTCSGRGSWKMLGGLKISKVLTTCYR